MRPGTQTAHRSALGLPYLLALPHAWAPAEDGAAGTWPLLVYLHGAGESGTDPNELLSEGATGTPPMLAAAGRQRARRPSPRTRMVPARVHAPRRYAAAAFCDGLSADGKRVGRWHGAQGPQAARRTDRSTWPRDRRAQDLSDRSIAQSCAARDRSSRTPRAQARACAQACPWAAAASGR